MVAQELLYTIYKGIHPLRGSFPAVLRRRPKMVSTKGQICYFLLSFPARLTSGAQIWTQVGLVGLVYWNKIWAPTLTYWPSCAIFPHIKSIFTLIQGDFENFDSPCSWPLGRSIFTPRAPWVHWAISLGGRVKVGKIAAVVLNLISHFLALERAAGNSKQCVIMRVPPPNLCENMGQIGVGQ